MSMRCAWPVLSRRSEGLLSTRAHMQLHKPLSAGREETGQEVRGRRKGKKHLQHSVSMRGHVATSEAESAGSGLQETIDLRAILYGRMNADRRGGEGALVHCYCPDMLLAQAADAHPAIRQRPRHLERRGRIHSAGSIVERLADGVRYKIT